MGVAELAVIAIAFMFITGRRGGWRRSATDGGLTETVRELQGQVEAAHAELDEQRRQLSELAERLDFTERRMVQIQSARPLLTTPSVEGTPVPKDR